MKRLRAFIARLTGSFGSPSPGTDGSTIEEAKRAVERQLLAKPGVVSVGIGLGRQRRQIIVIGVDGTRPDVAATLPRAVAGFPVEVRTIGTLRADSSDP